MKGFINKKVIALIIALSMLLTQLSGFTAFAENTSSGSSSAGSGISEVQPKALLTAPLLTAPQNKIGVSNASGEDVGFYNTWADAVAALNNTDGGTITLLDNITLSSTDVFPTKPCTIDGGVNKYSLTLITGQTSLNYDITFKDITIKGDSSYLSGVGNAYWASITTKGEVTIDKSVSLLDVKRLFVSENSTLSSHYIETVSDIAVSKNSKLIMSSSLSNITNIKVDGEILSSSDINLWSGGKLDGIGKITFTKDISTPGSDMPRIDISNASVSDTADITVQTTFIPLTGCLLFSARNTNPIANIEKLKLGEGLTGFVLKGTADSGSSSPYKYKYTLEKPIAQVNGFRYSSWADAVTALNNTDGGTITLLDNITLSSTDVLPSKPCKIDGGVNKYSLTFITGYTSFNSDITFKDITIKGIYSYLLGAGNAYWASIITEGEVTIEESVSLINIKRLFISENSTLSCYCIESTDDIIVSKNAKLIMSSSLFKIKNLKVDGEILSSSDINLWLVGKLDGTGKITFTKDIDKPRIYISNASVSDTADITVQTTFTPPTGCVLFANSDTNPIANIEKLKLGEGLTGFVLKCAVNSGNYQYTLQKRVESVQLDLSSNFYGSNVANYGNDVTLSATLKDKDGNALTNSGVVEFTVVGSNWQYYTIDKLTGSKYTVTIPKPDVHSYSVFAKYISDYYEPSQTIDSNNAYFYISRSTKIGLSSAAITTINVPGNCYNATEYRINLPEKLIFNKDDMGPVSYSEIAPSILENNGLLKDGSSVTVDGNSLVITVNGGFPAGKTAKVRVNISSQNYVPCSVFLTLQGADFGQYETKLESITPTDDINLIYGDKLSDGTVSGVFYNDDNSEKTYLTGTFVWDEPDIIYKTGTYEAKYTFYPDKPEYKPFYGKKAVAVTRRQLAVTLEKSQYSKTYGDADPQFNYTLTGGKLVGDDVLVPFLKYDGVSAGTYNIVSDTAKNTEYDITVSNGSNAMVINQRPLTIKDIAIADREYNGTPAVGAVTAEFDNVVSGETISYTAQGSYADANANNSKQTIVTVTLTGDSFINYSLAVDTKAATGNILKATTTANAVVPIKVRANVEREYGFFYSPSSLSVISLSDITNDTTGTKKAGNYNSFNIHSYTQNSFFAVNPHDNDTYCKIDFTVSGKLQPDTKGSITIEYGCQNYNTVLVEVPITVVAKSEVDISSIYIYNKTYNGTAATQYLQHILFLDKDTGNYVKIDNINYNYVGKNGTNYNSATPPVNAGDYAIVASIPDSNVDYYGSTEVPFTISKAPLTVTAKDYTITVGDDKPDYEITYSGFVNGETEKTAGMFTTAPAASCAGNSDIATTYGITLNTPVSTNYAVATVNGKLTVKPKYANINYFKVNSESNTADWFNNDIQIAATGVDGFDKIRIGDTDSFMPVNSINTEAANGTVKLYFAKNSAVTTPVYFSYSLDKTAPVLSNIVYDTGSNSFVSKIINYFTGRLSISVDCSDSLSGIKKVEYTLSGSTEKSGTASISGGKAYVSVDKGFKGTIKFTAYDNADNKSADLSSDFVTEDTAPTIGFSNIAPNSAGWYNKDVVLDITVRDNADNAIASGIKTISYKLNGGDEKPVDNINDAVEKTFTVTVNSEGLNTLTVTATDNSGNTSTQSYNVKLDKTAPNISGVNVSPVDSNHHYKGYVLTVSADDTGTSGVAGYSVDGGLTWQTGNTYQFLKTANANIMVKDIADNITVYSGGTVSVVVPKISTWVMLTADKTAPSYGDTITLSAQIKGEEGATEALDGNAAFYLGTDENGTKIADNIELTGGKASIALTKDIYKSIGEKNIFAVYSGNEYYEKSSSTLSCNVLPHELTAKAKDIVCYSGNKLPEPVVVYIGFADGENETNALTENTFNAVHTAVNTDTAGNYEIALNGSAKAQNYNINKQNGTLTVKAVSSNAQEVKPTDTPVADKPSIIIPAESVPAGIGLSSLRLIINEPTEQEKAVMDEATEKHMKSVPKSQLLQYDISLIDISNGNEVVEPKGAVKVILPYPAGTDKSYNFNIVHLIGGVTTEIIKCTNTDNGIEFYVAEFSPFIIGYVSNDSGSSDDNGNTEQDFWDSVENEITYSEPGDVIKANAADYINTIPVTVLQKLKGKDVVLTIAWQNGDIVINGKDIKNIEANHIFYKLDSLAKLYMQVTDDNETAEKVKTQRINPKTGKEFDIQNPTVIINSIRDIEKPAQNVTGGSAAENVNNNSVQNSNIIALFAAAAICILLAGAVIILLKKLKYISKN